MSNVNLLVFARETIRGTVPLSTPNEHSMADSPSIPICILLASRSLQSRLQPESGLPRFFEFGSERILNLSASVQSEATRDVQSEAVQSEDAPALARAAWLWSMVALEQQQAGPSSRLSYDGARAISSVDGGYAGTALAHG